MRFTPFLLLSIVLVAAGCRDDSTTPSAVEDTAAMRADQVLFGLHQLMTKNGVRASELNADTAYLFEEGRRFDMVGVKVRFFGENGAETGTLTSKTGEYDVSNGSYIARGNAVLLTHTPSGDQKLETEELHYDVNAGQLWSDKPFVLHRPDGSTTRGSNFRTDIKGTNWQAGKLQASGVKVNADATGSAPGAPAAAAPADTSARDTAAPQGTGIRF